MNKILQTFQGKSFKVPPIWFMRQAGRYLPEYQALYRKTTGFMEICLTPELATEVTLQPIKRFDLDAAIIFSDILMIPYALGQNVSFIPGQGPRLDPIEDFEVFLSRIPVFEKIESNTQLTRNKSEKCSEAENVFWSHLHPTLSALTWVRQELPPEKALIGFSGAPWTLMAYMIQGQGSKDFQKLIGFSQQSPELFDRLCDYLTQAIEAYLKAQIKAGAQVLQIFDSWAGLCPESLRQKAIFEPIQKLIQKIQIYDSTIPILIFAKGLGKNLLTYQKYCSFSPSLLGLGLDSGVDPEWALDALNFCPVLQGGPEPELLRKGGEDLQKTTHMYLNLFQNRPYIFNLGHGVLPDTPLSHVERMIDQVRNFE